MENQFRKLPIPCTVSYAYFEDECNPESKDCLEFIKAFGTFPVRAFALVP